MPISTSTSPSPVRWRRAITSNSWPRSTLLVSASTCPRGDVSVACGDRGGVPVCYPLTVEIYKPREGWVELGGERVRRRARPGVPRRRRRGYGCGAPALRFGRSLSLPPPFAELLSLYLCVRVVQVPMPYSDGVNKLIKQSSITNDHYFRDGFLVYNASHSISHSIRIHAHRKSFSARIILPSARCLDGSFSSKPQSTPKPKLEKLVSHLIQREGRGGRRKDGVLEGL